MGEGEEVGEDEEKCRWEQQESSSRREREEDGEETRRRRRGKTRELLNHELSVTG